MNTPSQSRATWLGDAPFGLMFHYLDQPASSNALSTTSSDDWNRRVDKFDVSVFSRLVKSTGAGHVIFTLGQNSGHYCSPNAVYDDIAGVRPSLLSRRDLIAELADALAPEVRLIAYLPSHAPANHEEAARALGCLPPWNAESWGRKKTWPDSENADERLSLMQTNWQAVVANWGERWGRRIAGWWIDGCYFTGRMYAQADEPNFASFARALRAGNADRILAFNSGAEQPFERLTDEQDYTAGEFYRLPAHHPWMLIERTTDGMQTHALGFLGRHWGQGEPRFSDALAASYTGYLRQRGMAVTWDIPVSHEGTIPDAFLKQLASIQ